MNRPPRTTKFVASRARKPLISLQLSPEITLWTLLEPPSLFETIDFAPTVCQSELWAPCTCSPMLPEPPKAHLKTLISLQLSAEMNPAPPGPTNFAASRSRKPMISLQLSSGIAFRCQPPIQPHSHQATSRVEGSAGIAKRLQLITTMGYARLSRHLGGGELGT